MVGRCSARHRLQLPRAGDGIVGGWLLLLRPLVAPLRCNHLPRLFLLLLLWRWRRLLLRHAGENDLLVVCGLPRSARDGGEVGRLEDNLSLLVGVGKLRKGGVLLAGKGGLLYDVELGLQRHLLRRPGHCRLLLLLLLAYKRKKIPRKTNK
jgi:hypothetical protein